MKATTSLTLTSSPNPSVVGQAVTFTAKITGNSPTGLVTFSLPSRVIGTATLSGGVATFVIASLPAGSNPVTASYPGDANNASDPEMVVQIVNAISTDSANLRRMQLSVMPSSRTFQARPSAALSITRSVSVSSGYVPAPMPNGSGFTYYFGGEDPQAQPGPSSNPGRAFVDPTLPNGQARLDDAFTALDYAAGTPAKSPPVAAAAQPRNWLAWVDVRGTDFSRTTFGDDLKGTQVNAIGGVTARFTPDFLIGVLGGYEHFNFTSQAYDGLLRGDGWTAGAYLGWRLGANLRFDASGAWTDIVAANTAGIATGNFTGQRWFASGGLTGTFGWDALVFEPSARVYALWERDNAYTDSLGALQAAHNFDTARAAPA